MSHLQVEALSQAARFESECFTMISFPAALMTSNIQDRD